MQAPTPYPVHYLVEYQERQSRLTTFFRWLLVIPHLIVVGLFSYLAYLCAFLAWFAILFTGRYPGGLLNLNQGYLRYQARVNAYHLLMNDRFPPFGPSDNGDGYPLQLAVDRASRLSRLTTFFRGLLIIPAAIVYGVLGIVALVAAVAAWLVILVMGRLPRGLFDFMALAQRYSMRVSAYYLLLTDRYPWFQPEAGQIPPAASAVPPATPAL